MSRFFLALSCLLTACGAAQRSDAPPQRPAVVAAAPAPSPTGGLAVPRERCTLRPRLSSCDSPADPVQRADLSRAIDTVLQRVLDARFQDADALVEVARLQLLRDDPHGSQGGQGDAEEARRNAMRALIVKPTAEARLVLALSMTRLYQEKLGNSGAKQRLFYQVLDRMLPLEGTGPAVSAAQTLAGYHALASGQPVEAKKWFELASAGEGGSALAERGLAALARPISLPKPQPSLLSLPDTLPAHEPKLPAACGSPLRTRKEGTAFCAAVEQLIAATTPATKREAALALISAYRDVRALCQAKDPTCEPNVVQALGAASYALGPTEPKSIAAARVAIDTAQGMAGHQELVSALERQIANTYFAIGELSQAGRWYQSYVDHTRGKQSGVEVDLALAAGILLGDAESERWARKLTGDARFPAERRASWSKALDRGVDADTADEDCAPILHCAFVELVRDRSWSPGARTR